MRTVFADTSFYIALVNHRDEHHRRASQFANQYDSTLLTDPRISAVET